MKNKLRITKHVNIDDVSNCWEWNRSVNSAGYGQLMEKSKYWLAHRYSYEAFVGDIPDGEIVRHMCYNTKCCNPDHLKTGTQKDNYHDSAKIHKEANKKRRKDLVIDGVRYDTVREANKATGINRGSIIKYTKDGVFDIQSYREGCYVAAWDPKV